MTDHPRPGGPHPKRIGLVYEAWLRDPNDYVPPDLNAYRAALAEKSARQGETKPPLDDDDPE